MAETLEQRDLKNRAAADLQTVKTTVAQNVSTLIGARTTLLNTRAAMVADPALYTVEEVAEVDAVIAWAVAQIQTVIS